MAQAHISTTFTLIDTNAHQLSVLIAAAYPRAGFQEYKEMTIQAGASNGAAVIHVGDCTVSSTTGITLTPNAAYTFGKTTDHSLPLIEYWVLATARPATFNIDLL